MLKDKKIGFIGGGNMAEALIKGLLAGGMPAGDLAVAEPVAERRTFLHDRYGVNVSGDNRGVAADSNILFLAVKPQMAEPVLAGLAGVVGPATLLVSIMAGVKTSTIEAAFATGVKVVRVMPNTPSLVLEGATALCSGANATTDDLTTARRIFELVGKACIVEEKLIDAVTGLSGSGPAFVLTFIEALSDAGVKNGLPRDIATSLAAQTVYGTARLLLETHEHPAMLRDKVTSPGGTTIAGLHVLEKEGFRGTVINAVDAATARSKELAGGK
ncbi:pyrroline-5-carboxylate reductase [Geobacter sp. AOG1]|uniref:pyrroline-5-carboxylate reductase n=1 Tax=Geobacter sp. AOG1 TaxID=1566346 RepID=UPI001CC51088|nr:pyrroline-5-carboxylate reductase [Geobacter sp. AOG1]GFE57674.1 pyrroline-5-carboxylate reductase [Geobacter sp. AOG1]